MPILEAIAVALSQPGQEAKHTAEDHKYDTDVLEFKLEPAVIVVDEKP